MKRVLICVCERHSNWKKMNRFDFVLFLSTFLLFTWSKSIWKTCDLHFSYRFNSTPSTSQSCPSPATLHCYISVTVVFFFVVRFAGFSYNTPLILGFLFKLVGSFPLRSWPMQLKHFSWFRERIGTQGSKSQDYLVFCHFQYFCTG